MRTIDGINALIAVDDAERRKATAVALRTAGARIELAASGSEALICIEHERFDVVLLDVSFPDIDILDLIAGVKRLARPAPRIIVIAPASSAGGDLELTIALSQGVDGHLRPPFSVDELLSVIDEASRRMAS